MKLYLFDMGSKIYGDCILAVEGKRTILIDGAHPGDWEGSGDTASIPDQLASVLGTGPFEIDLLVVTHCHSDHIGCLPKLVDDGTVTFKQALVADEGLGFPLDPQDTSVDGETAKVLAAIVEEPQTDLIGSALDEFLTDAVKLPVKYHSMLKKLEAGGTKVVRYSGASRSVTRLEKDFEDFNLKVLGPSAKHLEICCDALKKVKSKAKRAVDAIRATDAHISAGQIYQGLVARASVWLTDAARTAADDLSSYLDRAGPGAALNDQSIVLSLGQEGQKFLLTGDMQLAVPEVPGLDTQMKAVRDAIQTNGPYQFVKLPHHASYNGFDEEIFAMFESTTLLGISTGRGDPGHPDLGVLKLLNEHRKSCDWLRTDLNKLITVICDHSGLSYSVTAGNESDARPNAKDAAPVTEEKTAEKLTGETSPPPTNPPLARVFAEPPPPPAKRSETVVRRSESDQVEITAKIPHRKTKIVITVEIDPDENAEEERPVSKDRAAPDKQAWRSDLPPLLFVTHSDRLAANVGKDEAARTLDQLGPKQVVVDLARETDPFAAIRREAKNAMPKGVVILGGYDVIPSEQYDTLPPSLRASIGNQAGQDPDNFIVWSDQGYGDLDGDHLADVPVSRITDGHSAKLLEAAFQRVSHSGGNGRFGIRNFLRPFADQIFTGVQGAEAMLTSQQVNSNAIPGSLSAKSIYLMLHGSDSDTSRFWGETDVGMLEALTVNNVTSPCGAVVFAGCCWGALTVRTRAAAYRLGDAIQVVTPSQSIALSFLENGASAFVGCTGAHYSPVEGKLNYFGAPMHSAFWKHIQAGKGAAEALFLAKLDYIKGMPHGRTKIEEVAIENKILRQFTCLGLGW